ncbi:MAG: addiction module HigA family antidote [Cryomorphaceae bacterium]
MYLEPFKEILSRSEVASHLDVSRSAFNRLVTEKSDLTTDMALRLSSVLGGTPESWLNMQSAYDLWKAGNAVDLSRTKPLDVADYAREQ